MLIHLPTQNRVTGQPIWVVKQPIGAVGGGQNTDSTGHLAVSSSHGTNGV